MLVVNINARLIIQYLPEVFSLSLHQSWQLAAHTADIFRQHSLWIGRAFASLPSTKVAGAFQRGLSEKRNHRSEAEEAGSSPRHSGIRKVPTRIGGHLTSGERPVWKSSSEMRGLEAGRNKIFFDVLGHFCLYWTARQLRGRQETCRETEGFDVRGKPFSDQGAIQISERDMTLLCFCCSYLNAYHYPMIDICGYTCCFDFKTFIVFWPLLSRKTS